jgi:hypothetical protein
MPFYEEWRLRGQPEIAHIPPENARLRALEDSESLPVHPAGE